MNEKNDNYIGKILDDRYEILEVIGEGGMAVVYKALCHRLNRYVAIKIMRDDMAKDEEFRRRFCAESQAVAMLSHPNIVAVYDVSHSDEIEYIVMELVDGITLKQYMDKRGKLGWNETLHFVKQTARALEHAHQRGIIHRDIKPQNIMLLKDGTIKVGDFGIAALENEIYENDGQAIGSVHYIAPEQARGELPDARSDIYSLGVAMYEMLTAQLPYTGDTLQEIAVKHMNATPTAPHELNPEVPADVEAIVLKAMNSNIKERYASATEMLADIDAFIQKNAVAEQESETEPEEPVSPDVAPVRSISELSREKYRLRRKRSGVVSYMSGVFGVMLLILSLVIFLWDYWLCDVFSPAERVELPNFVGSNYASVMNNTRLNELYNFEITYVVDPSTEAGTIVKQTPDAGRSLMRTRGGVKVQLSVSSGAVLTEIPEVVNTDYREAKKALQKAGFIVEIENQTSDSFTKDYVMSTSPAEGQQLTTGSTVYLIVSSGPEISYTTMPNVIGCSESAAISKLESADLSYGGSTRAPSDLEAGTVIDQSIAAYADVEEHTKIYLTVSSGPEENGEN